MRRSVAIVRRHAEALLRQAFDEFHREHILPRSRYEPWIRVGRDYEGYIVHGLPAFQDFAEALKAAFPAHFRRDADFQLDFPELYAFPLIAAAVVRSTLGPYHNSEATSSIIAQTIDDLIAYLQSGREPTSVVRLVSDLTTATTFTHRGLRVVPHNEFPNRSFETTIERLIPGLGYEIDRSDVVTGGRDRTLLMMSLRPHHTEGDRVYGAFSTAARRARGRIDRFVSAARLATGGTISNLVDVEGQPGLFKKYEGNVRAFPYAAFPSATRLANVGPTEAKAIDRLDAMIAKSSASKDGLVPSLTLAIGRFDRSFLGSAWTDRLVDLSIALEAAIGEPTERQEITLRLRSRAASLLSTGDDPAAEIFDDLGTFYKLRSEIVHGNPHRTSRVKSLIESIPATSAGVLAGQ